MEGNMEDFKKEKDCNSCIIKKAIYDEIERLKTENEKLRAENASLLAEQNVSMLLLDLTLSAVKLWGQQKGLIDKNEDPASEFASRHDKASLLLAQTKKTGMEELGSKLTGLINALEGLV